MNDDRKLALFIDFENLAVGTHDAGNKKFDIERVIERLLEKGKIVAKRAYCDWQRFGEYKRQFHEAAIEMVEIPKRKYAGKNSADIRLVVDAMDMCYSKEHIDAFVILSGDSDLSPLVSKLKENDKYVIGVGLKNSTSDMLADNCDEFIFYEDIGREARSHKRRPPSSNIPEDLLPAFDLLLDVLVALQRENKDVLWGSMVKQTMKRVRPQFSEESYGYRTFSGFLQDAAKYGVIKLQKDQRSGSLIITDFEAL